MKKLSHRSIVQDLAASQHGFFTTAQAQDQGVSRQVLKKMENSGITTRVAQGVYRFESVPDDVLDRLRAIWISTNPHKTTFERLSNFDEIVIGGRTAAAIHGLGNFYLSPYTFFTPKRYQSRNTDASFIKRVIDPKDVVTIDGLPVTNVARTIFDLKADHEDPSLLAQALVDAIYRPDDFDYERLCELFTEQAQSSIKNDVDEIQDMFNDAGIEIIQALEVNPENEDAILSSDINVIRRSDGKLIPIPSTLLSQAVKPED